jgi:hypothetical protein
MTCLVSLQKSGLWHTARYYGVATVLGAAYPSRVLEEGDRFLRPRQVVLAGSPEYAERAGQVVG